ncbi:hypothetical protein ER308_18125 [Egibacter rhizosphaerae]|uniref:Uncharacterized protein n=1 Tax=Egibacter rhizosphaerae TaxID=1670831 RepID=A0A411YJI8_9ACTN|nr:hypothetical protein [Egibacter rhizosphaerae]QBI21299.1 hypothetical protein ER308_18125 [Egibacter rhizosphaerae]
MGLVGAIAVGVASWLEPRDRLRHLSDLVADARTGLVSSATLDRDGRRGLRVVPFPLVGPAAWVGPPWYGGVTTYPGRAVTLVRRDPGPPSRELRVSVSALSGDTNVARVLRARPREPLRDVEVPVDGRLIRFTVYPPPVPPPESVEREDVKPPREDAWQALGTVDELEVGLEGLGLEPEEAALSVGVDPQPYERAARDLADWLRERRGGRW